MAIVNNNGETQNGSKIQARTLLWYLLFFGGLFDYMMRITINIGMVDMVNRNPNKIITGSIDCFTVSSAVNLSSVITNSSLADKVMWSKERNAHFSVEQVILNWLRIDYSKHGFDWNEHIQGMILGSFYWIAWISQFFVSILAKKFGSKLIMMISMLGASACTILMPLSAYLDFRLLISLRVLQGIFLINTWPAMLNITGQWVPPNERGKFISAYMGSSVALGIFYPIFGGIMSVASWEWIFLLSGLCGILWCACWHYLAFDSPAQHPRIDVAEAQYIQEALANKGESNKKMQIPWKQLLTSRITIVIFITQFGHVWSIFTLMAQGPTYFKIIHGMSTNMTGVFTGIPFIMKMVYSYLFSMGADYLLRTKKLSRTNVRKIGGISGSVLHGVLVVGIGFSGCDYVMAILLQTTAIAIHGAIAAGILANIVDISPNFSGIIFSLGSVLHSSTGFLSPLVVGYLTLNNQTAQQWQYVFSIAGGISILTGVIFVLFTDAKVQSWNEPSTNRVENCDVDNVQLSGLSFNDQIK